MTRYWSKSEVEMIVEDYFRMLYTEIKGDFYNKSEYRREIKEKLNGRSDGSIELKHQNISAVLVEMGIPYVRGYKPRSHYQRSLLPEVVSSYLSDHPDIKSLLLEDVDDVPLPTVEDILATMEAPPDSVKRKNSQVKEPPAFCNPTGIDFIELEARNIALGEAGERFAINYERARLLHAGKESLAGKVEQVSVTAGPVAGFDIHSYEINGHDRFIETKTTKYGKYTPFYLTPNELGFSERNQAQYYLYRVFGFRVEPRLFSLKGRLNDNFFIRPSQYLASL